MSVSIKKQGVIPQDARLTFTDLDVLERIAYHGFQTYPELRRTALKKLSRSHSWVAMTCPHSLVHPL